MVEATKQCCRCAEAKPLHAYYAQGGACKTCTTKRQRELYAARTPEQIEKKRKSVKAFAKNNWDKLLEKAREQNKKPQRKEWVRKHREKNLKTTTVGTCHNPKCVNAAVLNQKITGISCKTVMYAPYSACVHG